MKSKFASIIFILLLATVMSGCGKIGEKYVYIDHKNAEHVAILKGPDADVFVEGMLISVGDSYSDAYPFPYICVKDSTGYEWYEIIDQPGPYTTQGLRGLKGWKVKIYGSLYDYTSDRPILKPDLSEKKYETILENVDDRYHWQKLYDLRDMMVAPEDLAGWCEEHAIRKTLENSDYSLEDGVYYSDGVVEDLIVDGEDIRLVVEHKSDGDVEQYFQTSEVLDYWGMYINYEKDKIWHDRFKRGDGIRLYYVIDHDYIPVNANPAHLIYAEETDRPFTLERAHGYYTEFDEIIDDAMSVKGTRFIVKKSISSSKRKIMILNEASLLIYSRAEIVCLRDLIRENGFDEFEIISSYSGSDVFNYTSDYLGMIEEVAVAGHRQWSDIYGNEEVVRNYIVTIGDAREYYSRMDINISDDDKANAQRVFDTFLEKYKNSVK